MIDPEPAHHRMPLQIVAGVRPRDSSMHSCMNIALRPSPTRFSRPQRHADPESII